VSVKRIFLLTAIIVSMLSFITTGALIGCDSGGNSTSEYENTKETCSDGIDNDQDGFTDCEDWDCDSFCP